MQLIRQENYRAGADAPTKKRGILASLPSQTKKIGFLKAFANRTASATLSMEPSLHRSFPWGPAMLLALYATGVLGWCATGFWVTDNGVKYLAAHSFGQGSSTILYPGSALDPEQRLAPFPNVFVSRFPDGYRATYPPFFSLLAAPLDRVFGIRGVFLLPLFGVLLTLLAARKWCRYWLLLLPASPLFFYGATFWEHTLVTGLVLWGLTQMEKEGKPSEGAVFLALAGLMRLEVFLSGVLYLLVRSWAWKKEGGWKALAGVGASFGGILLAGECLAWAVGSSLWGTHAENNLGQLPLGNLPEFLFQRFAVFQDSTLGSSSRDLLGLALFLSVVLLWLAQKTKGGVLKELAPYPPILPLVLLDLVLAPGQWRGDSWDEFFLGSGSVFLSFPLIFLFLRKERALESAERKILLFSLLLAGVVLLLVPPTAVRGMQWGQRLLLPSLVIWGGLILAQLPRPRFSLKTLLPWGIVLASVVFQSAALKGLMDRKATVQEIQNIILRQPQQVCASTEWWFGADFAALYPHKTVVFISDAGDLQRLLNQPAVKAGGLLLVSSPTVQAPGEVVGEVKGPFRLLHVIIRKL